MRTSLRRAQKQCAEAQDRYKKLIEGRHLYKTGDDGERQYLTSEEIDSERLTPKQDVDADLQRHHVARRRLDRPRIRRFAQLPLCRPRRKALG